MEEGLQVVHLNLISTSVPLITLEKVEVLLLKLASFAHEVLWSLSSAFSMENCIPERSTFEYGGKTPFAFFFSGPPISNAFSQSNCRLMLIKFSGKTEGPLTAETIIW